ncbi:RING-type E3 ubiquitin transferase [Trifolium repens]|nr:RING-type E3 ubiquitin transferase [Trifolium repens]
MEDQKPCHCPLLGCDFVASSEVLSNHFSHKHGNSQIRFSYGHNFVVYLKSKSDDETIKCKLKLQSFAKNITQFTLATFSSGFLVIPFSPSRLFKLEICIKPVPMMQIIIKMLDRRELPLSVKISDTIGDVKQQIFDKEGISYSDQRLIFSGKQPEDNQTLFDCNIEENSTIFLVLRLIGS